MTDLEISMGNQLALMARLLEDLHVDLSAEAIKGWEKTNRFLNGGYCRGRYTVYCKPLSQKWIVIQDDSAPYVPWEQLPETGALQTKELAMRVASWYEKHEA